MRKSIPPRNHSNNDVLPSQSRSRKASGTSPSRASCAALIPLSRKRRMGTPRMISATSRGFNASGLDAVVRSFLVHLHVVNVPLAETGCRDPDGLRFRPQIVAAAAASDLMRSRSYLIPPSEVQVAACRVAVRTQLSFAVFCGTPTPASPRVVHSEPRPIPPFTAAAPASQSTAAPSLVATLPAAI